MTTSKGQRYLGIAFFLTLAFCVLEYVGGVLSGSLALIADAGHMVADLVALGLAFFAGWFALKRPTPTMTFGYYRIEVLTALVNAALLLTIAVGVCREAIERIYSDHEIQSGVMIAIACAGLLVNIVNGFMLYRFSRENINIAAAFYHVFSDALSSVGVIIAGITIRFTGWLIADSVVSCGIALLIATSAWKLLKSVVPVLMEATPGHIDMKKLEERVLATPGVCAVHDLHAWTISPGKDSLSAHLEVNENTDYDEVRHNLQELLEREFNISHTTLQIERTSHCRTGEGHFHE